MPLASFLSEAAALAQGGGSSRLAGLGNVLCLVAEQVCGVTERESGLDGLLDPFEDDSWVSTECKMLHTTWLKVRSVLLARFESSQLTFSNMCGSSPLSSSMI